MKKLLLLTSFLFLGACAGNKINEDKPVTAEIYLIHSKMKAYEVIGFEDRRDWSEDMTIEEIINELPQKSESKLIYKTSLSTSWDLMTEKEEYNFIDDKWDIKNKEKLKECKTDIRTSYFKFKLKPLYFSDGRSVSEMRFNMKFLTEINSYEKNNEVVYYPKYESFQDSKSINFLPNKYYVFSTIPLKDKTSFIVIYKLKN